MSAAYRFGRFRLDVEAGILFRGAEPVHLGRRAVALLGVLTDQAGVPVSKDALIQAAWPGLSVEESNLTVQIAALRRALGEEPGGEGWIETLPRRGYRFVGPVETGDCEVSATVSPVRQAADASPSQRGPYLPLTPRMEPERRQVTVGFCELICPSALTFDVEDLRDVIGAYRRSVAETVSRCNGSIGKHIGNVVVVHFGHPAAHEDDAERAVQAGLRLCTAVKELAAEVGRALSFRVGIATGLVIVDDAANVGEPQEGGIVGEAPTVAGRLLGLAGPDTVVIDGATRRLIGNLFTCRDLGSVGPVAAATPTHAWQVLGWSGVDSRFEALRGANPTQLVGRDEELEVLRRRWAQACRGEGRVVLIGGEPGIGKSRIVQALQQCVQAEPHTKLRYFCSPYHTNSAFYPIVRQLEHALQFTSSDTTGEKCAKLSALLQKAARPVAHSDALLRELLSLAAVDREPVPEMSPQKRKETTFAMLLALIEGLAANQPALMIVEDVHWLDPTSLEFLAILIERVPSLPLLVIVTFRPEFTPPWVGEAHVTTTLLSRLDERHARLLVHQVAASAILANATVDQIISRADGVPLFAEELTKAVVESGASASGVDQVISPLPLSASGVPATLQALLMTRLDRVGSAKEIAQIGAAIGREYSYELLAAVSGQTETELLAGLNRLTEAGLLYCRGVGREATYLFKHALVQDAAYATLLKGRRKRLHATIAHVLEQRFPALAQAQPEVVAEHYTSAGMEPQAIFLWLKAGQLANDNSANREAVSHLNKGLEILSALPIGRERDELELRLHSSIAPALVATKGYGAAETVAAYERARVLMRATSEYSAQPGVLAGLYAVYVTLADYEKALDVAEECLAAAKRRSDRAHLCIANRLLAVSHDMAGNFRLARRHGEEAWALYDRERHGRLAWHYAQDIGVAAGSFLAIALVHLGCFGRSAILTRDVLELAERLDHHNTIGYAHCCGGAVPAFFMHDFAALRHHTERMQMYGRQHDMPQWVSWGACLEAPALAAAGELKQAIRQMEAGLLLRERINNKHSTRLILSGAVEVYLHAGRIVDALELLAKLLEAADASYERWTNADLWRLKGDALLASEGKSATGEAQACYGHALSIAEQQRSSLFELRAATHLARLMAETGGRRSAFELLATKLGLFADASQQSDLQAAKALLNDLR